MDSAGRMSRAEGDQPKILVEAAKDRAEASCGAGVPPWLRLNFLRRQGPLEFPLRLPLKQHHWSEVRKWENTNPGCKEPRQIA